VLVERRGRNVGLVASAPQLPGRLGDLRKWQQELQAELAILPQTLRTFRASVDNLNRITQRLLDATTALEQFTALSSGGMAEARRRLDEAAASLRGRATSSPDHDDPVGAAMQEVGDALAAMADLNPFIRRPTGGSGSPSKRGRRSSS